MSSVLWLPGQPAPDLRINARAKASDVPVNANGALAMLDILERAALDKAVVLAVGLSFKVDKIRAKGRSIVKTRSEVEWRTKFCLQHFAELTFEKHYGIKMAMSHLALALRKKLDQIKDNTAESKRAEKKTRHFKRTTTLSDLVTPE